MTPPRLNQKDDNFRFDNEFVALIKTQSEQKIQLDNLQEKIQDIKEFNAKNFENINTSLENLAISIRSVQTNCISHKVLEEEKRKKEHIEDEKKKQSEKDSSMLLSLNPVILKVIAFIIAMVIGYLLNIPINPTP